MKKKSTAKNSVKPRKAKAENSRSKLLKAGLDIFSRHGFHGATTKVIATKAGVNEALIMRHFKSKEGLFLAVLKEKHIEVTSGFHLREKKISLEEELVEYGRQKLKNNWRSEDFLKMLLSQFIAEDSLAKRVRKTLFEDGFCSLIVDRLAYFQKQGQLHKSYSIEDAGILIDKQVFITFMMHSLLLRTSLGEAQRQLEIAMRTVAKGLQKKL